MPGRLEIVRAPMFIVELRALRVLAKENDQKYNLFVLIFNILVSRRCGIGIDTGGVGVSSLHTEN